MGVMREEVRGQAGKGMAEGGEEGKRWRRLERCGCKRRSTLDGWEGCQLLAGWHTLSNFFVFLTANRMTVTCFFFFRLSYFTCVEEAYYGVMVRRKSRHASKIRHNKTKE